MNHSIPSIKESITQYQQAFDQAGIALEYHSEQAASSLWLVGITTASSALSAHGAGVNEQQATLEALKSLMAQFATGHFYRRHYLGQPQAEQAVVHQADEKWFEFDTEENLPPEGILSEELAQFYDPTLELLATDLIDLPSSNMQRGICALPFTSLTEQGTTYLPVNILSNLYGTLGLASAATQQDAREAALLDIITHGVNRRVASEKLALPVIDSTLFEADTQTAFSALEKQGFQIQCLDASINNTYPVVALAITYQSANLVTWGAALELNQAIMKAIAAIATAEPVEKALEIAESTTSEWAFTSSEGKVNQLTAILNKHYVDVLVADYAIAGIHSCQVIVPGWNEWLPNEVLIEANNNVALELRETLLAMPGLDWDSDHYAEMFNILEQEGYDDRQLVAELVAVDMQVTPGWQSLTIAELKAMLALAGGDLELAEEYLQLMQQNTAVAFTEERAAFYQCLMASLALALDEDADPAAAHASFIEHFGEERVANAWGSIEGEVRFYGLAPADLSLAAFTAHQQLISLYKRRQQQLSA